MKSILFAGVFAITLATASGQSARSSQENWVATWATPLEIAVTTPDRPVLPPEVKMPTFPAGQGRRSPRTPPAIADDQTVRMIVHTSIAGKRLRIELQNAFDKPVVSLWSVHIALRTTGSSIDPASDRQLTFGGRNGVDLRPGQVIVSDPVSFEFKPMSDIAVSLYVKKTEGPPTNHMPGLHTAYVANGDDTAAPSMPADATTNTAYVWLKGIDVDAPGSFAIACLGDSITDGFATTVDANQAWPTLLAKRLIEKGGMPIGVINEGISGNQILRDGAGVSAIARFDRDIIGEPGVRWVVLLEGINDINIHGQITGPNALTADDLIAGDKELIARAHMNHIKIAGATVTPDAGVWLAGPIGEATRQKLNDWIRTSKSFDAVVDLDAALRDMTDPTHLQAEYDSGDHIHPNDVGNAAMAKAFDLSIFTK